MLNLLMCVPHCSKCCFLYALSLQTKERHKERVSANAARQRCTWATGWHGLDTKKERVGSGPHAASAGDGMARPVWSQGRVTRFFQAFTLFETAVLWHR